MAEIPQQENFEIPTALFPAPPPFWKHFTSANLARLQELESSAATESEPFDRSNLSYDLAVLLPPPLPTLPTTYQIFTTQHTNPPVPTLPPPAPDGSDQLLFDPAALTAPSGSARPHVRLLWQLTKSLNLNFLELFTIMADSPLDWESKVIGDLGCLLHNIHGVINCLRTHQAREGVKGWLKGRVDDGWAEIQQWDEKKIEIESFLDQFESEARIKSGEHIKDEDEKANGITTVNGVGNVDKTRKEEIGRARKLWDSLDELDGD